MEGLLSQLCKRYPDHTEDLKRAILWKVNHCHRLPDARIQLLSQADDLKIADVETKSTQKVNDWIRGKDEDAELGGARPIVGYFPDGPHDASQKLVDIVVTTPASMFWGQTRLVLSDQSFHSR